MEGGGVDGHSFIDLNCRCCGSGATNYEIALLIS